MAAKRFIAILDIEDGNVLDKEDVALLLPGHTPGGRQLEVVVYTSVDDLLADRAEAVGPFAPDYVPTVAV